MLFKVYHSKDWSLNTLLHFVRNDSGYVPDSDDYEVVADVESESLGMVFQYTNSIDDYWWNNENVNAVKTDTRSTSVGDLVEDEDGKLWLCCSSGWGEVEWLDESSDSIRKGWAFWKALHEKFNDTNAENKMNDMKEKLF